MSTTCFSNYFHMFRKYNAKDGQMWIIYAPDDLEQQSCTCDYQGFIKELRRALLVVYNQPRHNARTKMKIRYEISLAILSLSY